MSENLEEEGIEKAQLNQIVFLPNCEKYFKNYQVDQEDEEDFDEASSSNFLWEVWVNR